jgi:hypothetical protein
MAKWAVRHCHLPRGNGAMMQIRFILCFLIGAALQAFAAASSRVIFSQMTYGGSLNFFLAWLGISAGLMLTCFLVARTFEHFLGLRRVWSHTNAAVTLCLLLTSFELWKARSYLFPIGFDEVGRDTVITFVLCAIASGAMLLVRNFRTEGRFSQSDTS